MIESAHLLKRSWTSTSLFIIIVCLLLLPVSSTSSFPALRSVEQLNMMTVPRSDPTILATHRSFLPSKINPTLSDSNAHTPSVILNLSGPDSPGILHAVTGFFARRNMKIIESDQFSDPSTKTLFIRVHALEPESVNRTYADPSSPDYSEQRAAHLKQLKTDFEQDLASSANLAVNIFGAEEKPRTLIMVSNIGNCLSDLLFRLSTNTIPITVPLIISNHNDFAPLAAFYRIPFYYLPIDPASGKTKQQQEAQVIKLAKQYNVEKIVLARYLQLLTPHFVSLFAGRIINIHPALLPSFTGLKTYQQAFERGVKLIGATANFVTPGLDDGPIIEQASEHVTHAMSVHELARAGASLETLVLDRAVTWMAERRIFINGNKTVVFT